MLKEIDGPSFYAFDLSCFFLCLFFQWVCTHFLPNANTRRSRAKHEAFLNRGDDHVCEPSNVVESLMFANAFLHRHVHVSHNANRVIGHLSPEGCGSLPQPPQQRLVVVLGSSSGKEESIFATRQHIIIIIIMVASTCTVLISLESCRDRDGNYDVI